VELLWEVCRIPDFQSVMTDAHARLLARIYGHLRGPAGRIPEDVLAAHVRDIDRTDGDVEVLLGRIAAIRTWTYVSHRSAWVPDARFWQERTRAAEDRLSDALHERLTRQFVDRSGAVIARHDPSDLVTSVAADGEVLVQGLRAGLLDGFRFLPDASAREGSRALLAAANRSLRHLVGERVEALVGDEDEAFRIGPGGELHWRGQAVARLGAGDSVLAPQAEVLPAELLDPPLRERVRRRLATWVEGHLKAELEALFRLRDSSPPGVARGLVFVLVESLGSVRRRDVAEQVAALSRGDRRALSGLGVTLGRLSVFLPALLRPATIRLRARLFAARHGGPTVPGPQGEPSVTLDRALAPAFYLACGYQPAGRRAVRVDRLDRAAAVAARLSRSGPFAPPRELPSLLGCPQTEVAAVLAGIGYIERQGRFEWRRRGRREARRRA
jgi:ATP-dependent RNA helicase SUPV3L1/SUV3